MKTKTTLKSLIKKNKLDWVNPHIIEQNFPLESCRSTEYKLFSFAEDISSKEAISEMKKENYVPANLTELLIWKDWNGKDSVVALDSSTRVGILVYVPCLNRHNAKRELDLQWLNRDWPSYWRLLGVRDPGTLKTKSSAIISFDTLTLETLNSRIEALEQWKMDMNFPIVKHIHHLKNLLSIIIERNLLNSSL